MFGGLGFTELLIIFAIILIIFGAKRLPEIGSGLGKGITNFKKAMKEQEKSLDSKTEDEERQQ